MGQCPWGFPFFFVVCTFFAAVTFAVVEQRHRSRDLVTLIVA